MSNKIYYFQIFSKDVTYNKDGKDYTFKRYYGYRKDYDETSNKFVDHLSKQGTTVSVLVKPIKIMKERLYNLHGKDSVIYELNTSDNNGSWFMTYEKDKEGKEILDKNGNKIMTLVLQDTQGIKEHFVPRVSKALNDLDNL